MRLALLVLLLAVRVAAAEDWTLQNAAREGKIAEIDALLAKGAAIDATGPDGSTALESALEYTQPEAARHLLDKGASIAGKIGANALALAARDGETDIVKLLLARGVSAKTVRPLILAAKYDRGAAIALLVKAGAPVNGTDVDDHHYTPLIIASQEGSLDAARVLIDLGARVNDRDDDKETALYWAVYAARPEEIHIYQSLDQPHDTVFRPRNSAPLVKLLVAKGAKLELADGEGNTPLHEAAILDARAAAEVLLTAGANRAARNKEGKTPLQLARDRNNSVVEVLSRPR